MNENQIGTVVVDAATAVHRELGPGLFESVYEAVLAREPKGAKTELVLAGIAKLTGPLRVADLQRACPGVGLDLIRKVLKQHRPAGRVSSTRRFLGASPCTWCRSWPGTATSAPRAGTACRWNRS